jgi:hypothetical protein
VHEELKISFTADAEMKHFLEGGGEKDYYSRHSEAMEKAIKSMNIIVYWFLGLMVFYLG